MKKLDIKTMVAIGIGAALFFVLGRFVAIPSPIPDTSINIQYAVLGLFALLFGPIAGFLIGIIGHTLVDLSWGAPWWSWILASGIFGLVVGLGKNIIDLETKSLGLKGIIAFNLSQICGHAVAWMLVAPGLDILIYGEPIDKVFAQGAFAGLSNTATTAIIGTILLVAFSKTKVKKGSLHIEQ
ncbi:ECF-type riboflavin transporter substrate-binding protein [Clostridium cylindrosporum]|uniref:UPF0397 protein CLCY_3c02870 n=1 Tax=Clostridium cylindrosporum DSM 605 TaxID=1121307 RepID=A0A0J8G2U6_CLOCY|nr:ECF-type riboflavin transporter substrate-binding protein [Clostridium cylindrosporum]KMT22016.1 hypothetical protein CLCY_3c02870 [Clostridium cylindrosporum DSM 605]